MKIRIWPVLLFGYSILVVLIAFSGFSALRRARSSYAGISQLYREELRTEQVLEQLRSEVLLSAIGVRDLLLMEHANTAEIVNAKHEELRKLHESTQSSLHSLETLIPVEYKPRLLAMTAAVDDYWRLVASAGGFSEQILRTEILPRRQAVLILAGQIEALTRDSIRKQREEIDRRQANFPFYIYEIVGGTILLGLIVAAASLVRIGQLERTAAKQHETVVDAEEELHRLSQKLVQAQEEERRSLSRDLHDQIGQVLTALRIGVGNLEEAMNTGADSARVQMHLDQSKRLSEQALRSVRDLAMGLRPAMLDDLGLGAALEWQARQFSRLCGVPASVTVTGDLEHCSDVQRTCIYRIVQEALNNVAKHAHASEVTLRVMEREAGFNIEVRDNGGGFDPTPRKAGGLGLVGIKERVRQLGGEINIDSKPAQGTALHVWLPLRSASEAA